MEFESVFAHDEIDDDDELVFTDRRQAGRQLAQQLQSAGETKGIIYGLPRGGVVLAAEAAKVLKLPLSIVIARKIGHPANPEYGIGAVTEHGEPVLNSHEARLINPDWLEVAVAAERAEATRRRKHYLAGHHWINPRDKTAIVVDDGVATGYTMLAAIRELRAVRARRIVVAAPVIEFSVASELARLADRVIALAVVENFAGAVGNYYENFRQLSDDEVRRLIGGAPTTLLH